MRILVTGAAGFVGSHLVELICEKGFEVVCLLKVGEDAKWIEGNKIQKLYGDVTDPHSLHSLLEGQFDYVFHLAAVLRSHFPSDYYRVNLEGTKNLVQLCIKRNIPQKRFFYMSSAAAVGPSGKQKKLKESDECRPVTDYGISKLEAEKFLVENRDRIPFTILRPSLVYGPRNLEGIFGLFRNLAKGIKLDIGEGMTSLIYVKDLARAALLAAESERSSGKIYFIGNERIVSYSEFSDAISNVMGKAAIRLRIPIFFLYIAGALLQTISKMTKTPPGFDLRRVRDLSHRYWMIDPSKFSRETGFIPYYSLLEGVTETVGWYRKGGWI